jgi:hypothetical protein
MMTRYKLVQFIHFYFGVILFISLNHFLTCIIVFDKYWLPLQPLLVVSFRAINGTT